MTGFSAYTLAALVALAAPAGRADDVKPGHKLVGTWKIVSAKYNGREQQLREGMTKLKHVTPTHFIWASYNKDGQVFTSLGGPYTLTGAKYEETPECGVGLDI